MRTDSFSNKGILKRQEQNHSAHKKNRTGSRRERGGKAIVDRSPAKLLTFYTIAGGRATFLLIFFGGPLGRLNWKTDLPKPHSFTKMPGEKGGHISSFDLPMPGKYNTERYEKKPK
jgi:hypothetical protein